MKKGPTKRVAPRITTKKPAAGVKTPEVLAEVDTKKAVAFGMNIVEQIKAAHRAEAERLAAEEVRLSRRPTTRAKGKTTEKFPASDLREFRKSLQALRVKAMKAAEQMRETGFDASGDHEADGGDGTAQTLRLQALGQMGSINRTIQQIDEALHRIDDGTYGVCTACGKLIRKPRLLNQPFVLTCMECQSDMERTER